MKKCAECCIKLNTDCPVTDCRYWVDYPDDLNCSIITVEQNGELTLREVAKRIGVSFVRIKQIQDQALQKVIKSMNNI